MDILGKFMWSRLQNWRRQFHFHEGEHWRHPQAASWYARESSRGDDQDGTINEANLINSEGYYQSR